MSSLYPIYNVRHIGDTVRWRPVAVGISYCRSKSNVVAQATWNPSLVVILSQTICISKIVEKSTISKARGTVSLVYPMVLQQNYQNVIKPSSPGRTSDDTRITHTQA